MKTFDQVNRRDFLKMSATAGVGLALSQSAAAYPENKMKKSGIPMRTLGRTGIKVPILSMGVFVGKPEIIKAAYNSGVTHFDTANGYQNGKSEELLGDFFAGKPRESYVIATKVNIGKDDTPQQFIEKFEAGMKRLKMDYVDILYRHDVREVEIVNQKPIQEAMLQLQKVGKVKHLGISTHINEPAIIDATIAAGCFDVVLTSYNFTQKHLDELNPAIERAAKAGLGIVGMKNLAGGYLDKEQTQKVNSKAAFKWALQNPNIHTIIPGYTTFDQLEECLDAVTNLKMTREEKQFLSSVACQNTLYCQGCRVCMAQCPEHLPIPDMMRAYMYNYGYQKPALAKDLISELALAENLCSKCSTCKVTCTAGFHVAEKIKDIARLQGIPKEFLTA